MKAKSLKTIAVVFGSAACFSTTSLAGSGELAASPGQLESRGMTIPGSRDSSGQSVIPGQPSTVPGEPSSMPGSGTGYGGSGDRSSTSDTAMSQAAMSFSDAEILGAMNAIDENEIAAANAAKKEKMGDQAKAFSKMLRKQHSANFDETRNLSKRLGIPPVSNQTAKDLRSDGAKELATLVKLEGKEFERAYIDAMVSGHSDALQLIDAELLPAAKNDEVRAHVDAFRGHVSAHLEEGKRLQEVQASRAE
jgi:putative membrane protein